MSRVVVRLGRRCFSAVSSGNEELCAHMLLSCESMFEILRGPLATEPVECASGTLSPLR